MQLANVEVALPSVEAAGDAFPAEEQVACGLHQPLPGDDAVAAVVVLAVAEERLEHRGLSLLDLQEERVGVVTAEEQRDPGSRADAADPDDLAGEVDEVVLLEQAAAVGREGAPVVAEHAPVALPRPHASRGPA